MRKIAELKEAKIFMNGQSQAVRLPKEFRFSEKSVFIKRVGDAVVLLPRHTTWSALFEALENFSDDYMDTRDQGTLEEREGMLS